jgi:hypothetical protein
MSLAWVEGNEPSATEPELFGWSPAVRFLEGAPFGEPLSSDAGLDGECQVMDGELVFVPVVGGIGVFDGAVKGLASSHGCSLLIMQLLYYKIVFGRKCPNDGHTKKFGGPTVQCRSTSCAASD